MKISNNVKTSVKNVFKLSFSIIIRLLLALVLCSGIYFPMKMYITNVILKEEIKSMIVTEEKTIEFLEGYLRFVQEVKEREEFYQRTIYGFKAKYEQCEELLEKKLGIEN